VKLYNLDHSPYATRVRIQMSKKNLDIAIEPPPEAMRTPAFSARFPLGKIPILEFDDGSHLADSWVIMEYLEDMNAAVSLRPDGALARAQMLALARYADTCLGPDGVFPLFALARSGAGAADAEAQLVELDQELARLERLLSQLPNFADRELHLGDIALVPHMDYALLLAPLYGMKQPLSPYPQLSAWWEWVKADAAVEKGSNEMLSAARAFFGG
jgi:glutathione S-transferase